ncbi:glycosyltransferase family 2 protein [Halomonas organivorans]|uniref:Glycosyltransferase involved in cell wall biosynthesis n=1 Tax=Halomonas organivorans TaxID=257772 RepID=A0A7W5BVZ0_9GAMM|nr:glycosyltransferase [Halomonas organivorans]MBB3140055.1 glycosyltransferase involved in cell wall biosynthesis [Halomonas organivorans]
MNKPLVSFYMTVRNGLPYLHEAVDSIRNQTYENWEAVIVDDGSTDQTLAYLREVESQDDRFRIFAGQGCGRGKALNMALKNARGLYVANLDADDLSHPQRLEMQAEIISVTECRFLCAGTDIINDDVAAKWTPFSSPFHHDVTDVSSLLMKSNPVSHISMFCRRDDILSVGGYSETRKSQLDYELWFRLVMNGVKLYRTSYPLAAKRIHARQSFENKNRIKYLFSSVLLQKRIISELRGGNIYYLYLFMRLIYGLLPQGVRMHLRQ